MTTFASNNTFELKITPKCFVIYVAIISKGTGICPRLALNLTLWSYENRNIHCSLINTLQKYLDDKVVRLKISE